MLRADVLGPQGVVLESSAFSEVRSACKPAARKPCCMAMKKLDGYRVVRAQQQPTQLGGRRLDCSSDAGARLQAGLPQAGR